MMIRPPRIEGWRTALNEHINAHMDTVFSHDIEEGLDCARWTGSAKRVVTGQSYPLLEKAKYKSVAGSVNYLTRHGCTKLEELTDKVLGERYPISFAGAGDAVLADLTKLKLDGGLPQIGLSLGICNGSVSYFVGDKGLIRVPTLALEACYYG